MLTQIDTPDKPRPRKCRRFIVYDGEWVPGTYELRMMGVYDGAEYRCYKTIDAFIAGEFTHKNRGAWFYAHAGGLADIQFLVERIYEKCLDDPSWSMDAKFSGSAAIIAKIRHQRHLWTVLDSLWLFRDSLANIGRSLGMLKGEPVPDPDEPGLSDEEHKRRKKALLDWYAHAPFNELKAYNEQDCRILWYAIDRFQSELMDMGGELQMTIASTGMNLFRRKYLSQNIDSHSYVNECAIQAYAASRVEKHCDSVEDSWYYDINSSFPYAMTFPAPGNFLGSSWKLPDSYGGDGDESGDDARIFLADCEVEVPDLDVPPLAYRLKSRVFFPTGRWRNWFCNVDLAQLQREGGRILKVHEVLRFDVFNDLRQYCLDIYNKRKNTEDPFLKIVYKYLLNCLYGKFAEMMEKDTLLINPPQVPITAEEAEEMQMRQWLPGAWLQTVTRDVPHRIVPIATHITAIGRRTLGHYLSVARNRHYCDTDGFSTNERFHWTGKDDKGQPAYHLAARAVGNNGGFVPLDSFKDLGGMKLEKIVYRGHFAGSKGYMLEGVDDKGKPLSVVKFKGMSRMTATRYMELVEGKAIDMERMARIRERLSKGHISPADAIIRKRFNFVSPWSRGFDAQKHVVPKRFPYPDGQTRAWHVTELKEMLE